MNGYDPESVARSVRHYFAGLLPQPWNVMLESREVRDDERPAGLIEIGETRTRRARVSVPQGEVEEFVPLTLTLWPTLKAGDGSPLTPQAAGRNARLLAGQVRQLIVTGAEGVALAGPERIPLHDYSAVPSGSVAGLGAAIDTLWVEDYNVNAIQDPMESRRWAVTLDARLSWERPGASGPAAETWTEIIVRPPGLVPPTLPERQERDRSGFVVVPFPEP